MCCVLRCCVLMLPWREFHTYIPHPHFVCCSNTGINTVSLGTRLPSQNHSRSLRTAIAPFHGIFRPGQLSQAFLELVRTASDDGGGVLNIAHHVTDLRQVIRPADSPCHALLGALGHRFRRWSGGKTCSTTGALSRCIVVVIP